MTLSRAIPLVLFLLTLPAAADTRAELDALLSTLRGDQALQAVVAIDLSRKSEGRFANHRTSATLSLDVTDDGNGLTIRFPRTFMDRAAVEAREREADPNKVTAMRDALQEIDAVSLADLTHFAGSLQRMLRIAKVIREERVVFQGKSTRLLSLQLTARVPREARSVFNVRFTEDMLKLWITDDGAPLAAERSRKGTAGFLFLRGEMRNRDSWTLLRHGDHLVVTRHENTFFGSGFGQKAEGTTVRTVIIR